jgi:ABC-type uncharacterized transport system fused permease/ATPase subunit
MMNSGCGKSSLLRAISGLWTHGSGIIERPSPVDTMFLPQKPYMPLLDLRGQLMYPRDSKTTTCTSNDNSNRNSSSSSRGSSDAELLRALHTVRLGHIAHRLVDATVTC